MLGFLIFSVDFARTSKIHHDSQPDVTDSNLGLQNTNMITIHSVAIFSFRCFKVRDSATSNNEPSWKKNVNPCVCLIKQYSFNTLGLLDVEVHAV